MEGNQKASSGEYVYPEFKAGWFCRDDKTGQDNKRVKLQDALSKAGIDAEVLAAFELPHLDSYVISPGEDFSVRKFKSYRELFADVLMTDDIEYDIPIEGTPYLGMRAYRENNISIGLRDVLAVPEFRRADDCIPFCVGVNDYGRPVICDLLEETNMLIAGTTGSGKSVYIDNIMMSIMLHCNPADVQVAMVSDHENIWSYSSVPHMVYGCSRFNVKTTIRSLVEELNRRIREFAYADAKDYRGYNRYLKFIGELYLDRSACFPRIVLIIDDFVQIMRDVDNEILNDIYQLARKGKIVGIHMVIATSYASSSVFPNEIKDSMMSRVSFTVASRSDSKAVLGKAGAEALRGDGDLLFYSIKRNRMLHLQGVFIKESEMQKVIDGIWINNKS